MYLYIYASGNEKERERESLCLRMTVRSWGGRERKGGVAFAGGLASLRFAMMEEMEGMEGMEGGR